MRKPTMSLRGQPCVQGAKTGLECREINDLEWEEDNGE